MAATETYNPRWLPQILKKLKSKMAATDTYNPRWLPQKLTIQDGGHRYLQSKMVATETYKMADTDTYNPRWLPSREQRMIPMATRQANIMSFF